MFMTSFLFSVKYLMIDREGHHWRYWLFMSIMRDGSKMPNYQ